MRPYQEVIQPNTKIRKFTLDVDSSELVWHRDEKDRYVTILEGKDWEFQLDNELPLELKKGDCIFIPKQTYHRIIKGTTDLVIHIQE
jgi:quercetin dioxygenase-like cupin family protein